MARVLVIIPAAGAGTRFGGDIPKQFQPLAGKPILQHVVERLILHEDVQRVMVAVSEQLLAVVEKGAGERVRFTAGGASRQQSVINAFRAAGSDFDLVAVHDAVRPFFADATFRAVLAVADATGAALPGVRVPDTIHTVADDFVDLTLDRNSFILAQTPQCFRYEVLRDVLDRAERDGDQGTDEAGLAAKYGVKVRVLPGDSMNFKITRPDDLAMAEAFYAKFAQ
jgi:2-C-methyl-D-erythritol 4-phosphate cytidylyltransferase